MADQLASSPEALRLFFTEDIFIIPEPVIGKMQGKSQFVHAEVLGVKTCEEAEVHVRIEEITAEASTVDANSHLHDHKELNSSNPSVALKISPEEETPELQVFKDDATEVEVLVVEKSANAGRKDFVFLGQNKRNILILVNDANHEVSSEQGRELLKNIVKAINLSGVDFALLNYSAYQGTRFEQLQEFFSSKVLFAFGVSATQIGLQYEEQNSLIMHEGIKMIFSANIDELSTDIPGKKALWSCLKKLDV